MHEIDYEVHGDAMQFVEIKLDPVEAAVAEASGMMTWTTASRWKSSLATVRNRPVVSLVRS